MVDICVQSSNVSKAMCLATHTCKQLRLPAAKSLNAMNTPIYAA